MRRAPALFVAAGLLLVTLSACSTNPNANCDNAASSGKASDLISVSGALTAAPKVNFPTPLNTKTTERTIVKSGDKGAPLETGQAAFVAYSMYDATTGKLVGTSGFDGTAPTAVVIGQAIPGQSASEILGGLSKGLQCVTPGSRVAIAMSPKDGFGADGASAGLGPNDSLVMVADITKAFLPRANGTPQVHQPGFPSVVLAPNGTPGITVPKTDPPKNLKIAATKQGDGKKVKRGDNVIVQYTGVLWKEGTAFDSSWKNGSPISVLADSASNTSATQSPVPPGFATALIGQNVGSQVVAILPPSKGYGKAGSGEVPANATLVYVIDILGIQ